MKVVKATRSDSPMSGSDLMEIARESVVRISTTVNGVGGHGTAFAYKQVINGDRSTVYFITNLHNFSSSLKGFHQVLRLAHAGASDEEMLMRAFVILGEREFEVDKIVAFRGALFAAEFDHQHDFAIFSIEIESSEPLPMFALPSTGEARQGEQVFAFGYPSFTDLGITDGIVSKIYGNHEDPKLRYQIQHSVLINKGNSGGPTVNTHGVAVGMSTWGIAWNPDGSPVSGLNFSVDVAHTFEICRQAESVEEISMKKIYQRFVARAREHVKFGS